ncbi:MAG TPA: hypothetical protein VGQ62_06310 [Chloroflexota bacterium]|nr:hypothetical protein [Chloroflexota bacterium]
MTRRTGWGIPRGEFCPSDDTVRGYAAFIRARQVRRGRVNVG